MEEGTFREWLKEDAEAVATGDLLFAMESDKVTLEVESLDAGTLHIPLDAPKPGDNVVVGQVLGYLLAEGESIPVDGFRAAAMEQAPAPVSERVPAPALAARADTPVITPRARRVARELGILWADVPGTGRGGRIREADVRYRAKVQAPAALPFSRRVIAERMLASQQKTAAVTLYTTADATVLVRLHKELKAAPGGAEVLIPSYTDMLVKLVADALRKHPALNSRWDGDSLLASAAIHIGIAVDTEAGLLVPVVRDVAALTLREVAARTLDLTDRARSKRLSGDELRGGTFTLTNLGSFGIDAFTPIINYPECAILGVGRILRQPVAIGEAMGLRDITTLSLTFDHRALDGAPAARFLQTLTSLIESPTATLVPGSSGRLS
jgi:pyruvate dehydrogenase E2 component (dihydrolipoamide acetyltransferase)